MDTEYEIIGISLYIPEKSNGRASVNIYKCCNTEQCPLFPQNKCIMTGHGILYESCPYGRISREQSSTKRSRSYSSFVSKWRKEKENTPVLPKQYFQKCMQKIGDYVYLPYFCINHMEGKKYNIPFEQYSSFLTSGSKFMKWEYFTVETIINFTKMGPKAVMNGSEIKDYQQKELPRFFIHLRDIFPELYEQALQIDPKIKNYISSVQFPKTLQCSLKYIPPHVTKGYQLTKDYVVDEWDGENIICRYQQEHLPLDWNMVAKTNGFEIRFSPDIEKTKVIITDEEFKKQLCLDNTELLD